MREIAVGRGEAGEIGGDVVQDEDVDEGGETRAGLSEAGEATTEGVDLGGEAFARLGGRGPADDRHHGGTSAGTGRGAQPSPRRARRRGRVVASATRAHAAREDATREDARVRREAGRRAARGESTRRERTKTREERPRTCRSPDDISQLLRVTRTRRESRRGVRSASADDRPIARERHCGDAETRGGPS